MSSQTSQTSQIRIVAAASVALLVTGCQSASVYPVAMTATTEPTPDQTAGISPVVGTEAADKAAMDQLSSLAGVWQLVGEGGELGLGSTFAVTSSKTAVREIMFAGEEYEMTNFYHMDGTDIVCTHYCAAGNQPRMVASGVVGSSMDFKVDSVSNFRAEQDHYMGGLKLILVDDDTIEQHWTSFDADGVIANEMVFVMKRVGNIE